MKALVGNLAGLWGFGGVVALLATAIVRLSRVSFEAIGMGLGAAEWLLLVVFTAFMVYSEGIRGFQQAFSPRVAARARHLRDHPRPVHVLLAPLFCMAFFHTTPRRRRTTWILTIGIIILVWFFKQVAQPLRGILDAGVVAGLTWGVATLLFFGFQAWTDDGFDVDPALPDS